jgi:hypothetical protein
MCITLQYFTISLFDFLLSLKIIYQKNEIVHFIVYTPNFQTRAISHEFRVKGSGRVKTQRMCLENALKF